MNLENEMREGEVVFTSLGLGQIDSIEGRDIKINTYPRIYDRVKESIIDGNPHMDEKEISLIKESLKPHYKVFEWGSGGSTIYFSQFVDTYVSVENLRIWFELVSQRMFIDETQTIGISHGKYSLYYKPELGEHKVKRGSLRLGYYYYTYINAIDECGIDEFDVIIIDGMARPSCVYKALNHVHDNSVIFFHDYFKYPEYRWLDKKLDIERPLKDCNLAIIKGTK